MTLSRCNPPGTTYQVVHLFLWNVTKDVVKIHFKDFLNTKYWSTFFLIKKCLIPKSSINGEIGELFWANLSKETFERIPKFQSKSWNFRKWNANGWISIKGNEEKRPTMRTEEEGGCCHRNIHQHQQQQQQL